MKEADSWSDVSYVGMLLVFGGLALAFYHASLFNNLNLSSPFSCFVIFNNGWHSLRVSDILHVIKNYYYSLVFIRLLIK
jgi:hypothetical protein